MTTYPNDQGNAAGAIPVWVVEGPPSGGATTFTGQAKLATAGTAQALSAQTMVNGAVITALTTNTGKITVGPSGVNSTIDGTGNGYVLIPGQSVAYVASNLNVIYINGTVTGDAISYIGS